VSPASDALPPCQGAMAAPKVAAVPYVPEVFPPVC